MAIYKLPYGSKKVEINIPETFHVDVVLPSEIPPALNPEKVVRMAIDNPVGKVVLENLSNIKTVAITVNDKTRPVPHEYLLPPLLQKLDSIGIGSENITLIIATGTHTPMPSEEFIKVIPREILNNYHVVSHDCDDNDNLEYLGETTNKTPIFINRIFLNADLRIVVGNIEPHHFMGFSGGVKSAAIGVAGRKTIDVNHAMLMHPDSRVGEYQKNPMRQDIEEIGVIIGVHFALNAVLNTSKKIVQVFFGDAKAVMGAGIPVAQQVCQTRVTTRYDLVIVSPGGHPKDINLYQAQKGLTHAAMLTREGGVIILVAACPEASGSKGYEDFMVGVNTQEEVILKSQKMGFKVGPHKAYQIARVATRMHVILVSDMPPDKVRQLLLEPAATLEQAFEIATHYFSKKPSVAIMPFATNTIPVGG